MYPPHQQHSAIAGEDPLSSPVSGWSTASEFMASFWSGSSPLFYLLARWAGKGHAHGGSSGKGTYHAVLLLPMSGSLADLLLWVLLRLHVKLQQSKLFHRVAVLAAEEATEQAAAMQQQRQQWYSNAAAGALRTSRLRMARLLRINALKNIMLEDGDAGLLGFAKSLLGSSKLDEWSKLNPGEDDVAVLDLASRYPVQESTAGSAASEGVGHVEGIFLGQGDTVVVGGGAVAGLATRAVPMGPGDGREAASSQETYGSVLAASSTSSNAKPPSGPRTSFHIPSTSSHPDLAGRDAEGIGGLAGSPVLLSYMTTTSSSIPSHQRSASDPTLPWQQQQQRQHNRGQAVAAIAASVALPRVDARDPAAILGGPQSLESGRVHPPAELRLSDPRLTLLQPSPGDGAVAASTIGRTLTDVAVRFSGGIPGGFGRLDGAEGSARHSRVVSSSSSRAWEAEAAIEAVEGGSRSSTRARPPSTTSAVAPTGTQPVVAILGKATRAVPVPAPAAGAGGSVVGWSRGGNWGVRALRHGLAVLGSRGCQSTICYSLYLFAYLCDYSLLTLVYPFSMLTWALLSQRGALNYWKVGMCKLWAAVCCLSCLACVDCTHWS
jgi:hypothetical protein